MPTQASARDAAPVCSILLGAATNVVRELADGKDFLFTDRGEANLKGFDEPVRLFELRWRDAQEWKDVGAGRRLQ